MTTNINADDGVVSGVAGLKTSADNSGVLALQTNGTTGLTVNASQYVGIGGTPDSAGYKLQVLGSTGITGIQFTRTGVASGNWSIAAGGAANTLQFTDQASSAEKARINAYGFGIGGAVPSSGMGITFPAAQSASSDANTLDDYEEGTWTPFISFGGGTTGITYYNQTAIYTKIGRTVVVQGQIYLNSKGSSTGVFELNGLPFVPSNYPSFYIAARSGIAYTGMLMAYINASETRISLLSYSTAGAETNLTNTAVNGGMQFYFSCAYQTA